MPDQPKTTDAQARVMQLNIIGEALRSQFASPQSPLDLDALLRTLDAVDYVPKRPTRPPGGRP